MRRLVFLFLSQSLNYHYPASIIECLLAMYTDMEMQYLIEYPHPPHFLSTPQVNILSSLYIPIPPIQSDYFSPSTFESLPFWVHLLIFPLPPLHAIRSSNRIISISYHSHHCRYIQITSHIHRIESDSITIANTQNRIRFYYYS